MKRNQFYKTLFFSVLFSLFLTACQDEKKEKLITKKTTIPQKKKATIPEIKHQEATYSFELPEQQEITGFEISLKSFGENQYKISCDTSFFIFNLTDSKSANYSISVQEKKQLQYIDLKTKLNIKNISFTSRETIGEKVNNNNTVYYIRPIQDSSFVNMKALRDDFLFDIRYATPNNFTGSTIYNCPTCLLRWEVAKAVLKAAESLEKQQYKLLFYDCYRPIDGQKRLWEKVPNPTYVANPYTKGSIHSRGCAIDLSVADEKNQPLEMGTDYDFFGRKARPNFTDLPKNVLENRELLSSTLEKVGFKPITSEWWHFNFRSSWKYPLSNTPFNCED